MKYPVKPCPCCGYGDAEEDAKGVGLIIGFHPQDPNKIKLPGTILFIGCNHCEYVGPIVLSPNGFSERRVINAWNEHINPGSTISTDDLVAELARRETVELIERKSPAEGSFVKGPCKILVVKG